MSQINKKLKVYVVGNSTSYASWLNKIITSNMEEADLVLFTGGADVNPLLYKQKEGKFTYADKERDVFECFEADRAISLKKPIWGTCRGIQLGCVLSGGMLIQHMNHPGMHSLVMYDDTVMNVNSLHHQLQYPYNLHPLEFSVIAYAKGLSNIYLNGNDQPIILPTINRAGISFSKEPEIVYYRSTNWLGAQHHPEMMAYNAPSNIVLRSMVDLLVDGTLDIVLTLDLPTTRYVNTNFTATEDEIQMYDRIIEKRSSVEKAVIVN